MPDSRFDALNGSGRFLVVLGALTAAAVGAACRSTPATPPPPSPDTWAVVDGRAIKQEDVERTYRRTRDTTQILSDEETLLAKLSLLDDLVVQDILLAKAAALKIEVPQTELDEAEANAKKNIPDDAFQQELKQRGLTVADLREGLRRELTAQKVLAQEVEAKVMVTDEEVTDFFNANRSQFNLAEESYRLAQIVVTPVREPQAVNRTGDDAGTPEAATAKAQMLMERLKAGQPFGELALAYSEDPESGQRGGDIGLVPLSRLQQAPPALRNAVLNKTPGSVNVAAAGGAYTLVLVVAHEVAGQRDLSTPGVSDGIRQTLRGRKLQVLRTAYLTAARNDARVDHYMARRLVASNGTPP